MAEIKKYNVEYSKDDVVELVVVEAYSADDAKAQVLIEKGDVKLVSVSASVSEGRKFLRD